MVVVLPAQCFTRCVPKAIPANAWYRQMMIRCGKGGRGCRRCDDGREHGPYWYAGWSKRGPDGKLLVPLRNVSAYVGRALPATLPDETVVTLLGGRRVTAAEARAIAAENPAARA